MGKKQARLTPKAPADFGDVYTFTALDASSRMIIAYRVGKRDEEKPVKMPLRHRAPEGAARELPNGRGFLRVVQGGKGAPPTPRPEAPTPPRRRLWPLRRTLRRQMTVS